MTLTGKAKYLFEAYIEESALMVVLGITPSVFYDMPTAMQFGIFQEWTDGLGYFTHIEPHLGGGQPVFYLQIEWRNENFVNEFWQERFDNGEPYYLATRQEAESAAIPKLNELINSKP